MEDRIITDVMVEGDHILTRFILDGEPMKIVEVVDTLPGAWAAAHNDRDAYAASVRHIADERFADPNFGLGAVEREPQL